MSTNQPKPFFSFSPAIFFAMATTNKNSSDGNGRNDHQKFPVYINMADIAGKAN